MTAPLQRFRIQGMQALIPGGRSIGHAGAEIGRATFVLSQPEPSLATKVPIDATARRHNAPDLAPEVLFERGSPWHELEAQPIVDHGEAPGGERHPLAVYAGDPLPLRSRLIGETRICGEPGGGSFELPPLERREEIADKHQPLTLSSGQSLFDQMIGAGVHRLAHLGAEPSAAERRIFRKKLAVEPCRSGRGDLLSNRQVRPGRERQPPMAVGIIIYARLDDRARASIARELQIAET